MLLLAFAMICAALLGSLACEKKKPVVPPLNVVVTSVLQKDVPITQEWVGTLEGSVTAEIRPKVEGFIVKQLYAEGTGVKEGAPLFQIDPRSFKAALDQARGNLSRNEAALHLANITVERYTPLAKENAVSQQELDDALSSQRQAQGNVESAKAQLEQAQLNLNWCTVTSLIRGIAGTAQIQVGSLVNPNSVLTTVSTVHPIRAVFAISEQQYLHFAEARKSRQVSEEDRPLHLLLADGTTYPFGGKIIILNRQVDVKTGTITLVAEFPNSDGMLRPGQYAKVRLVTYVKEGCAPGAPGGGARIAGRLPGGRGWSGRHGGDALRRPRRTGGLPLGHRQGPQARRAGHCGGATNGEIRDEGPGRGGARRRSGSSREGNRRLRREVSLCPTFSSAGPSWPWSSPS